MSDGSLRLKPILADLDVQRLKRMSERNPVGPARYVLSSTEVALLHLHLKQAYDALAAIGCSSEAAGLNELYELLLRRCKRGTMPPLHAKATADPEAEAACIRFVQEAICSQDGGKISSRVMHLAYEAWCFETDSPQLGTKLRMPAFAAGMSACGSPRRRSIDVGCKPNGARDITLGWYGVGFKPEFMLNHPGCAAAMGVDLDRLRAELDALRDQGERKDRRWVDGKLVVVQPNRRPPESYREFNRGLPQLEL